MLLIQQSEQAEKERVKVNTKQVCVTPTFWSQSVWLYLCSHHHWYYTRCMALSV